MKLRNVFFLLIGIGLLAFVISRADIADVGAHLGRIGVAGIAVVLSLSLLVVLCDTSSWAMALPSVRIEGRWLYRLLRVRIAGEAFNAILPAGSLGGEPVKAVILKRQHGIDFRESGASLVIAKTVFLLALIAFAIVGFWLMARSGVLPRPYALAGGTGIAVLCAAVAGFLWVQRRRMTSRVTDWLNRHPRIAGRLEKALVHLEDVDDRFHAFYHRRPGRFAAALGLALGGWLFGMAELYSIMYFLGSPITLGEAWMMESVLQLVRAGTFFIPSSLGASEVGFVVLVGMLAGQPPVGLAAAAVRRGRELVWIAGGLAMSWRFAVTPAQAAAETGRPTGN